MCGICGLLPFENNFPEGKGIIENMCAKLVHRGPDASGIWDDGLCFMGHRRLAILDTSDLGNQPMTLDEAGLVLSFNGEIYNYIELVNNFGLDCSDFFSRTDTEVLLRLWAQHGTNCIRYLSGMFAFAIWDKPNRALYLVRDRLGIKPLYYALMPEGLYFASEIPPLLGVLKGRLRLNHQAIYDFMRWGYINWPKSIAREIMKVPPGSILRVDQSKRVEITRFWSPSEQSLEKVFDGSQNEFQEEFETRLEDAVRMSMRSDVPIGCFLSSGMDSASVACAMASKGSGKVVTFTVGNKHPLFDESVIARSVAAELGTDHNEVMLEESDVLDSANETLGLLSEPHGDYSIIPTSMVSKLARQYVTVAITGDGGDELFFGYDRYISALKMERFYRLPAGLRKTIGGAIKNLLGKRTGDLLQRPSLSEFWAERMTTLSDLECRSLMGKNEFISVEKDLGARGLEDMLSRRQDTFGNDMMLYDLLTYLTGDNLFKVDFCSMQHSLEVRPVLLENEIVNLLISAPLHYKFDGYNRKLPLRRYLNSKLHYDITAIPKRGFTVPMGAWMKGPLKGMIEDYLADNTLYQLGFSREKIEKILNEHFQERKDRTHTIWRMLVLALWLGKWASYFHSLDEGPDWLPAG